MASSQVEITSSSPFGCVLKDSNKRSSRDNNDARAAAFQKNLKELVRDHFHNCISISADENENDNQFDSRVAKQQGNKKQQHHPQHNPNLRFLSNHHGRNNNENKRSLDDSDITSSSRQSRMLDRWAARQAREMVSSIEKQSQEAEQLASSSSGNKDNSHSSSNVGNLGASSLVQIWEARLNRSKSMNMSRNSNSESSSSRTSSPDPSRDSEMEDCLNSMNNSNHEDSCTEWDSQSDRTAQSEPSQGRNLDGGEKERVRVADIIKKLTSGNDENENENENEMVPNANASESPSRERRISPVTDQPEQQRGLPVVVNSPKIRGRQAFADLLMQLERDRHRELDSLLERQAVSRFIYRGRIQAMLRIRFLQRGLAIQEQQRPQPTGSPAKLLPQGSITIMHLREKFSSGVEQGGTGTAQSDATATRTSHTETVNNRVSMESCSPTTNQRRSGDCSHQQNQEAHNVGRQSRATIEQSVPQTSKDNNNNRESSSRTNVETAHEVTAEAAKLLKSGDRRGIADDQEQQHTNLNSQNNSYSERITSLDGRNENVIAAQQEQEANEHPNLDLANSQETSLNDWDENHEVEESYEQGRFVENNYDWISEISRPRSYWEDRRQAWYQKILSTRSENEEIRQLLERRRVSSFLASDFRETMDQLMTSRIERQIDLEGFEDEEEDAISRERIGQLLLSHLQRHLQPAVSQEEEQAGEEEEDGDYTEEEEQSPTSHEQHHETSDYSDQSLSSMQMPSPTTMQSWDYRHREVGDDHSDPVGSASSPHQDSRMSSSSANRLSIEMELVYDLRGQMAQLHREMTELRKSIRSCIDMQVTLQHPHPQEVRSVRGTENNSLDVATKKRKCCICYEMNVDSLLYRCGHMCTCLKCAHELQWGSGKCPICRAPIADVVKAYMDS